MAIYIAHSRTKGSKNGERRYQNADGTWTNLGKERRRIQYATEHLSDEDLDKATKRASKEKAYYNSVIAPDKPKDPLERWGRINSSTGDVVRGSSSFLDSMDRLDRAEAAERRAKEPKKDLSHLSDDDLRKRINRIRDEATYRDLTREPETVNIGRQKIKEYLAMAGAAVTVGVGALTIISKIREMRGD